MNTQCHVVIHLQASTVLLTQWCQT